MEVSLGEERLNICIKCNHYKFKFTGGTCSKCGCIVALKVKFKKQKCPVDKW